MQGRLCCSPVAQFPQGPDNGAQIFPTGARRVPDDGQTGRYAMRPTGRLVLIGFLLSLSTLFCTLLPSAQQAGPTDDGERIATLDAISEVVESSTLPDGEVDKAALLKYFESNPQFEGSGEAPDGSVWARFNDGRLVIVPPPIPESAEGEVMLAPSSDPVLPTASEPLPALPAPAASVEAQRGKALFSLRQQGGPEANLPASDNAMVMSALGTGFRDASSDVHAWLNEQGYSSSRVDPTVENLKSVENVGVFYINSHGGQGCLGTFEACEAVYTPVAPPAQTAVAPPSAAPPQYAFTYALWTSTPVSKANDATYKADLDGGFLAYSLADPAKDSAYVWRYAITGKFVRTYMRFSDYSLVFIDACSSEALWWDIQEANAGAFVLWTAPTTSLDRPNYFFDRMLGINGAVGRFNKPEPPNRPFSVARVMETMRAAGTSTIRSANGPTTLVAGASAGDVILRPTIEKLVVHEDNNELEIEGSFGSKQGHVTIDEIEAAVQEWTSKKIRVTLPAADESGGAGDVIVKVGDHESNAVPLTLWHVKFTYTEGPEQTITAYQRLYLDLYWRADVHRYRDFPDADKFHDREPVTLEPADASSGSWDCTWEGSYAGVSFATETGEGDLPFNRKIGTNGWTSSAQLDPGKHSISHLEFMMNFDPETICIVRTEGYGFTDTEGLAFVLLPSLMDEINPDSPVTQPLELDDQWMLVGAKRDLMHDGMWPWLEWEDTQPEHAPDPKETEA